MTQTVVITCSDFIRVTDYGEKAFSCNACHGKNILNWDHFSRGNGHKHYYCPDCGRQIDWRLEDES